MFSDEKDEVVEFWKSMPVEDRTKLLKSKNCWEGVSTYFWQYLPTQIKTIIEEEFEKSRR